MNNLFDIKGNVTVITGGTGILGRTIAKYLTLNGSKVIILGRKEEVGNAIVAEIRAEGGECEFMKTDVMNIGTVKKNCADILAKYGRVDTLLNAAGGNMPGATIPPDKTVFDLQVDQFQTVLNLNLTGTVIPTQVFLEPMVKQGKGGSIVSTASMSGHVINQPQTIANYCAAKAGVINLTKGMSVELTKYGIRVNCVSPGYIQTDLIATMTDMLPIWLSKMPEGARLGYPEDLIGAYVYFVSDASKFATGSDLVVDGGYTTL